jgi:hypothetical protein
MKNLRALFLTAAAAVATATAFLTPVLADERFGVITNVDLEGNTLTLLKTDEKELEIKTTAGTQVVVTGNKVTLTLKDLASALAKDKEAGRKGTFAQVTHENNVAAKIRIGSTTTKKPK